MNYMPLHEETKPNMPLNYETKPNQIFLTRLTFKPYNIDRIVVNVSLTTVTFLKFLFSNCSLQISNPCGVFNAKSCYTRVRPCAHAHTHTHTHIYIYIYIYIYIFSGTSFIERLSIRTFQSLTTKFSKNIF